MISKFVTDSKEAIDAISLPNVIDVWINGSETFVTLDEVVPVEKVSSKKTKNVAPEAIV